jgi:hypothetical protein
MLGKRKREDKEEEKDTKRPKLNMREGKVDFQPLYEAHKRTMTKAGCEVDRIIEVRQDMHANAEGAFEEHWTHKKIKDTLLSFEGFKESDMKVCAKTGLVVDIKGTDWTGPASK